MNTRRTNKSHKVPNVKLRPATKSDPHSYPSSLASNPLALPSLPDLNETFVDNCPRPFQGVVVCATGISDKTTLFKKALELGAGHHNHFTDRVTHLIADEHGGAKYSCAVQMKIPILRSSWISECHEIWLRGDDVDFERSIVSHRLPIFTGVVLALSGIEDLERRIQISRTVSAEQGTFVKNVERPVKVTHLLCSGDNVTDKMKYAQKFNERGEANIKLVWEEWFWDSVSFGGRFDESEYLVSRPRPEPKSPPHRQSSPSSEHQIGSNPTPPPESSSQHEAPHLVQNEDAEEIASVKRVPHVTLQLWESLLGPRGFEIAEGKLKRSPTKGKSRDAAMEDPDDDFAMPVDQPKFATITDKGSLLSNFKRTNSFAPQQPVQDTSVQKRQPFSRTVTTGTINSLSNNIRPPSIQPVASGSGKKLGEKTFFAGHRFRALGEARCFNVKSVVETAGGIWVVEDDEEVDFIVVRLVSGSKFYRDEGDEFERTKYRTECWLERCNYEDRVCDPNENVTFRPLGIEVPVSGAEDINLSFSGLDASEACWVRRFARATGMNLAQNFSRRSTHLLCPSYAGAKYDKAKEWNIPVIDMSWLEQLAGTGIIASSASSSLMEDVPPPVVGIDKEKDKEVLEVEDGMMDITNNVPSSQPQEQNLFQQKPILLNNDVTHFAFDRSSQFVGHSTPKRKQPVPMEDLQPGPLPSERQSSSQIQSSPSAERVQRPDRIPSSETPSPMRIRSSPDKNSQLDEQATKKLQESIANLLGKRRSVAVEMDAAGGVQQRRAAKRSRPMGRTRSGGNGGAEDDSFDFDTQGNLRAFAPMVTHPREEDVNASPGKEERLIVMYEDPKDREEKNRLMSLLENASRDGKQKGSVKRNSTRITGF